jgi:hypothetical protein
MVTDTFVSITEAHLTFLVRCFYCVFAPRMQKTSSSLEHLKYLVRAAVWTMTLFTILMTRMLLISLNKTVYMIHLQSEYYNVMVTQWLVTVFDIGRIVSKAASYGMATW